MKKFLSLVLLISMMMLVFPITAYGAGDTIEDATVISLNQNYDGSLSDTNKVDIYEFTLDSSSRINIKLIAKVQRTDYVLYDSEGNKIWNLTWQYWNETTEQYSLDQTLDLTKGTYYFSVSRGNGDGEYNFSISATSANESFTEMGNGNNNSLAEASEINFDTKYNGQLAQNDDKDVYTFTLDSSSRVNIKLTAKIHRTGYELYDVDGNKLWSSTYQYWNETTQQYALDQVFDLTKGTYYFAIGQSDGTGNYNFTVSATSANESFTETGNGTNNSITDASEIEFSTEYNGQLAQNDDKDVYVFTLDSSSRINIKLTAKINRTGYELYDADGNRLWNLTYQYWNETTKQYALDQVLDLTKGTYYFAVGQSNGTGNYNFTISATSANESFTETANGTNNSLADANGIELNTKYYGQIAQNDDKDVYSFALNSSMQITIKVAAGIYRTEYSLYDVNGNVVWDLGWQYWNDTTKQYTLDKALDLDAGTYYFAVATESGTGNYDFVICDKNYIPDDTDGDDFMLGDVNDNGEIDSMDYILLKRAYFGTYKLDDEANKRADVNANGEIDSMDYILLKRAYFGTYKIQ